MSNDIRVTLDQDGLLLSKKITTDSIQINSNKEESNLIVVSDTYSSNGIRITKDQGNPISARVGAENTLKVVTGVSIGGTITSIFDLDGLDISGASDGDILVYNSETNLWTSVDEIDGGDY